MGIAEAASFTISGGWDVFDKIDGLINWIESQIDEEDERTEFHMGDDMFNDAHFFTPADQFRERLDEAREHNAAVRLICQEILAAV